MVVGRFVPNAKYGEAAPMCKVYRMKLFAKNLVCARSRFWYFMGRLCRVKKANGQIISVNQARAAPAARRRTREREGAAAGKTQAALAQRRGRGRGQRDRLGAATCAAAAAAASGSRLLLRRSRLCVRADTEGHGGGRAGREAEEGGREAAGRRAERTGDGGGRAKSRGRGAA